MYYPIDFKSKEERNNIIAANIRNLRKKRGLTQKELGERCNIDEANIRKYELGKQIPKFDTLIRISGALNVSTIELAFCPEELENQKRERSDLFYQDLLEELGYNILDYDPYLLEKNGSITLVIESDLFEMIREETQNFFKVKINAIEQKQIEDYSKNNSYPPKIE